MREITVPVEIRTHHKKKVGQLRRNGFIPGVYYLHGEKSIPLKVKEKALLPLVNSTETHILNLDFTPGEVRQGIIREVQFDPLTEKPLHVDFQGILANEELTIDVPIVLTGGTPVGVRFGGILQHVLHSIQVACLPKDIPEHIEINVSELAINHSIHVGDLKIDNIRILTHAEDAIVLVLPPVVEKTETTTATEETAEPEVIGKGKKEEEGAAEATPAKAPAKEKETGKK